MISKLIAFQFPAVYFPLLLNISLRIPLIKNPKTFSSFVWMNICVSVIFAVRPRVLKIQNNTFLFSSVGWLSPLKFVNVHLPFYVLRCTSVTVTNPSVHHLSFFHETEEGMEKYKNTGLTLRSLWMMGVLHWCKRATASHVSQKMWRTSASLKPTFNRWFICFTTCPAAERE